MSRTYQDADRAMIHHAIARGPVTVHAHHGHPTRTATLIAWDPRSRARVAHELVSREDDSSAVRTWSAGDRVAPTDTAHTSAHPCADVVALPHTCRMVARSGDPSRDNYGALVVGADGEEAAARVPNGAASVHGRDVALRHHDGCGEDCAPHAYHGVADLQVTDGLCGHAVIQPQTGAGVNHKLFSRETP